MAIDFDSLADELQNKPVTKTTTMTEPISQPTDVDSKIDASLADILGDVTTTPEEKKKSISGFVSNLFTSGGQAIGGIASMIRHPIQTVKGLGSVALGGVEKLIPGEQPQEQAFNSVVDFFKERYGSLDKAVNTAYDDPVGFALDVSTLLSGAGGAVGLAGKAGKVSGLVRAGETLGKAATTVDPLAQLTRGAGGVVKKLTAPFAERARTNIINLAEKTGIDLPVSSLTKSGVVKQAEALSSKGLFGQNIEKTIEQAANTLDEKIKTIHTNMAEKSPAELGEILKEGFDKMFDNWNEVHDKMYDDLSKNQTVARTPVRFSETLTTIDNLVKSLGKSLIKNPIVDELKTFANDIRKSVLEGTNLFETAKQTRTNIGQKLKSADAIATGNVRIWKDIYRAVSTDIDAALYTRGPKIKELVDKVTKTYKEGIKKFNSPLSKTLQRTSPTFWVNKIFTKKMSPDMVDMAVSLVGEARKPALRQAFTQKILSEITTNKGVITSNKLSGLLKSYSPDTLVAIFGNKNVGENLSNYRDLLSALEEGQKVAGGSQTTFLGKSALILSATISSPVLVAKILLGDKGLNALMTSKLGKKYLTTGLKGGQTVSDFLKEIAPIISAIGKSQRNFLLPQEE